MNLLVSGGHAMARSGPLTPWGLPWNGLGAPSPRRRRVFWPFRRPVNPLIGVQSRHAWCRRRGPANVQVKVCCRIHHRVGCWLPHLRSSVQQFACCTVSRCWVLTLGTLFWIFGGAGLSPVCRYASEESELVFDRVIRGGQLRCS